MHCTLYIGYYKVYNINGIKSMKNIVGRWKTIWRPPRGHKGAMPWGVRPIKLHITHHISQALSTNCIFVLHILDILHIYNISFIIHNISRASIANNHPSQQLQLHDNYYCSAYKIHLTIIYLRESREYMILQDKGTQKK